MTKHVVYDTLKGLSYYLLASLIYGVASLIAGHSPARTAYGMISAWWAALYFCAFLDISMKHILYLVFFGVPYAACLASRRHDAGYTILGNIILLLALLSPLLVNTFLVAAKNRLSRHLDSASAKRVYGGEEDPW